MSSVDPIAILTSLGIADATAVTPVSGGWDTAIWRVERAGDAYALRLFRAEQAGTCRREVAAMRAASAAGLPVPQIHAETVWRDRPALLLSWSAGRPLAHELAERPWRVWRLGVAFGRMQARLHTVPAPDALCREPGAWIAWAGSDEGPLQDRLCSLVGYHSGCPLDAVPGVAGVEVPLALLHLDYHPLNVLTDDEGVTAVLDWANARAGDRRADLARTVTILRLAPLPPGASPLLAIGRRALERGWRGGYRQVAGPLGGMAPFYAWAGAVMARDLAPKIGRPGVWLEPRHLDAVRRWTAAWKRRAGLPSSPLPLSPEHPLAGRGSPSIGTPGHRQGLGGG